MKRDRTDSGIRSTEARFDMNLLRSKVDLGMSHVRDKYLSSHHCINVLLHIFMFMYYSPPRSNVEGAFNKLKNHLF
jgi:hypothetical protein